MWHMDQTLSLVVSIRFDVFVSVLPRWMEEAYRRGRDINAKTQNLTILFTLKIPSTLCRQGSRRGYTAKW